MSESQIVEEKTAATAIAYEKEIPQIFKMLGNVHTTLAADALDESLIHLVQLRASQINQCGFCVGMHVDEALRDGESHERLSRLVVWRHVADFTEREKAALAWCEALTVLENGREYGALRAQLREHFTPREISLLTVAVSTINMWNRIQASRH